MKKSVGERRHWESLKPGDNYILETSSGSALVKVVSAKVAGVEVEILDGGFKSSKLNRTLRKGDSYTADPAYAEFFEPKE